MTKDRNEQADLFGICLTGADDPALEDPTEKRPALKPSDFWQPIVPPPAKR